MELEAFKSSYGYWNFRTNNGKPTEEMVAYLKKNGYRWSKNNGCWYPATSEAKEKNLHGDFAAEIQKKFDEEKKTLERNRRELPSDIIEQLVDSATNNELGKERVAAIANSIRSEAAAERTVLLEELVEKLREQIRLDQEKIQRYEAELAERGGEEEAAMAEQEQIDAEVEWEKENALTEEEEKAVVEKHPEPQIERKAQAEDVLALSPEELAAAKSVMPDAQYRTTLNLSQGEEREFFIGKLKSLAAAVNNAPKIGDGDGAKEHPIVFRYFHPTGTETLVTEIGSDGEAYGFQCLNGDYEMAEWGYLDLNEIKGVRMMEIDDHVPEGMTVEKWLYKNHPEEFPQYAENTDRQEIEDTEKTPFDIAQETGNDVEAIARSLQNGVAVEKEAATSEKPEKNFSSFQYNGFNYIPYRSFKNLSPLEVRNGAKDESTLLLNNISWEQNASEANFVHKDFYHAAGNVYGQTNADIFYCVEKDGFYIPVENNILRITEDFDENYKKEFESFRQEVKGTFNKKEVFTPRPVALENILARMDFQLEVSESGKLMVYDTQRGEYLDNENDVDVDNAMREFNSAEEVFDRMDSFIRDYYFADMQEELDKIGVDTSSAASLADMCELYRAQIEKGQTRLSETTLNWALGIVHPDTVVMPKGFVPERSGNKYGLSEKTMAYIQNFADVWAEHTKERFTVAPPAPSFYQNYFMGISRALSENEERRKEQIEKNAAIEEIYNASRGYNNERPERPKMFDLVAELVNDCLEKKQKIEVENNVQSAKLNFVLDKLSKAGIEVVTDKAEFNRILKAKKVLQKMEKGDEASEYIINFEQTEIDYFNAIDNYLYKGIAPKNNEFVIKKTPEILAAIGIPKHEIIMTTRVINKAKDIHHLTNEEIKGAIKRYTHQIKNLLHLH